MFLCLLSAFFLCFSAHGAASSKESFEEIERLAALKLLLTDVDNKYHDSIKQDCIFLPTDRLWRCLSFPAVSRHKMIRYTKSFDDNQFSALRSLLYEVTYILHPLIAKACQGLSTEKFRRYETFPSHMLPKLIQQTKSFDDDQLSALKLLLIDEPNHNQSSMAKACCGLSAKKIRQYYESYPSSIRYTIIRYRKHYTKDQLPALTVALEGLCPDEQKKMIKAIQGLCAEKIRQYETHRPSIRLAMLQYTKDFNEEQLSALPIILEGLHDDTYSLILKSCQKRTPTQIRQFEIFPLDIRPMAVVLTKDFNDEQFEALHCLIKKIEASGNNTPLNWKRNILDECQGLSADEISALEALYDTPDDDSFGQIP